MFRLFNLLLGFVFAAFAPWIIGFEEVTQEPDPTAIAKALAALGSILILGLGGVLVIALTGRWFRRWIFSPPKKETAKPRVSPESIMGRVDWASPDPKHSSASREQQQS